jgi:hypothetical protein
MKSETHEHEVRREVVKEIVEWLHEEYDMRGSAIAYAIEQRWGEARTSVPPEVVELLCFLLTRIGSWTSARWDQHARYEKGDEAADMLIAWLKSHGIDPAEWSTRKARTSDEGKERR